MKILISNSLDNHALSCEYNKGSEAVAIATIKMLRQAWPDAEIASFVQFTDSFTEANGIRVIESKRFTTTRFSPGTLLESSLNLVRCKLWAALHKHCPRAAKAIINNKRLREYTNADIVLDLGLDTYSDDYGMLAVIEHSKDILLGLLLRRPVVIWAQSLGPFQSKLTKWLVKFALNRVALITAREEISLEQLRLLGINGPPIHLTADPAFLLEPASEKTVREMLSMEGIRTDGKPLVGLTLSWSSVIGKSKKSRFLQIAKEVFWIMRALLPERLFQFLLRMSGRYKRLDMASYIDNKVIAEIADYLVERLDAYVLLVPHDYNPAADDRKLLKEILKAVKHNERVKLLAREYSAPQLKGFIGQCDMFVGGKMHANIAALSMCVPTVGIQYGSKFYGIMRMLGQEQYVCDKLTFHEVRAKIDEAWSNREGIRAELKTKLVTVKKQALQNCELVKQLVEHRQLSNTS
ncbi:MAG TPA: polysaccharide pyruvyl transferase family protein [Dehalococcoidia bacterium]|nr:polysaccharide pyruvyl transferase family protein [Dehalococcoidia bacterium]